MSNNLQLGPEASGNSTLAVLRELDRPRAPLSAGERICPGVFMAFDPEVQTKAKVASPKGKLFKGTFELSGNARWLGLHIQLGAMDLSQSMLFGIACRSSAPSSMIISPCLRSATEYGFTDTFFPKKVIAFQEESLHLDALLIEKYPELLQPSEWRELILFLRPESCTIDLNDLRIFTV